MCNHLQQSDACPHVCAGSKFAGAHGRALKPTGALLNGAAATGKRDCSAAAPVPALPFRCSPCPPAHTRTHLHQRREDVGHVALLRRDVLLQERVEVEQQQLVHAHRARDDLQTARAGQGWGWVDWHSEMAERQWVCVCVVVMAVRRQAVAASTQAAGGTGA